ncbi:MAG: hypothetical protein ACTSSQ_05805, partial [Alphaproteobacteria bacterium]
MTLSQRIAAIAAVLLSAPVLLAPVAHADPGTFRTSERFVVAQLAEPEAVLQAREDLLVAEQALMEAKANGSNVKTARRALRRARRNLDQILAATGAAPLPTTPGADAVQPAGDKMNKRRRKQQEAARAAAEANAAAAAQAAAQAQAEAQAEAQAKAQAKAQKATDKAARKAARKAAKQAAKAAAAQAAAAQAAAAQQQAAQAAAQDNQPEQTGIKGQKVDPRLKKLRRKLRAARQENRELQNTVNAPAGAEVVRTQNGRTIIKDQSGRTFIQSH